MNMDRFKEAAIPTLNLSLLLSMLAWILTQSVHVIATSSEVNADDSNAPPCSLPLNKLYQAISEDIFPEGYKVFLNCLSFNEHGALKRGIVSGHESSENQTMRFVIECASEGSILVALQSEMAANITSDIREQEYSACMECEDSVDIDPCRTRK